MQHAQPWLPSNFFRIFGVKDQGCHCCWQGAPSVSAKDLVKVVPSLGHKRLCIWHLHAHFPEAASSQSQKAMSREPSLAKYISSTLPNPV